jgi:hypothetical protein
MLGCAVMSLPEDIFVDSEGMNASISLASTVFKKAAMKWDGRPKEMYTWPRTLDMYSPAFPGISFSKRWTKALWKSHDHQSWEPTASVLLTVVATSNRVQYVPLIQTSTTSRTEVQC